MTKYMNTPLVSLKSVGSLLDIEDKVVYPSDTLGYPDLESGTPLVEVTDEWAFSLSDKDKMKLEKLNLLERW